MLWHIHDFYSHRPRIGRWVRMASKRASGCIAISKAIEQDVKIEIPGVESFLLLNCVDTEVFSPGTGDPVALDRAVGLSTEHASEETIRIGLVATYARWKGHDVFLRAIAQVPDVRAYIIGGPIYTTKGSQWTLTELQQMAKSLGIEVRVGFVPFQSDPCWIYRSLDIVVHASTRPEPFGLTIVEAMACSKPVVVSAAGGAGELFEHGESGFGFSPGSDIELASVLRTLLAKGTSWDRIGIAAKKRVDKDFSTDVFGDRLLRIYDTFLDAR